MGYSIGISVRSPAIAKRLLSFMKRNYRSWPDVAKLKGGPYAGAPTGDMSYDRRKSTVGLDYGPVSGWEREYAYTVVRWMAVRAGRRRSSFPKDAVVPNRFPKPVPYMTYDGHQNWPVLVVSSARELTSVPKGARWCACDHLGIRAEPWTLIASVLFDLPNTDVARVLRSAEKEAGPTPGSGAEHWAWVERRDKALLRLCRKQFDLSAKRMRDELTRLHRLWESQPAR